MFKVKTVTVSLFSLFYIHLDSEPLGMIINLIIKHLLPTAPAHSLSAADPRDPITEREEREGHRRSQRRRRRQQQRI